MILYYINITQKIYIYDLLLFQPINNMSINNLTMKKQNLSVNKELNVFSNDSNGNIEGFNISKVKFHPNINNILAIAVDKSLYYCALNNKNNAYSFDKVSTFDDHFFNINCLTWDENGYLLATGGNDSMINIYDVNSNKLLRNISATDTQSAYTCLDFNYSSNLLISGIYDKQIHVHDLRMNKYAFKIMAHSEPITSLSFSDDGLNFISTSYDGFLRVWDIYKGCCLKTISIENSPGFTKAELQPDGIHAIVSSLNNQIMLINLQTEEEILRYSGHSNTKYILDFDIVTKNKSDKSEYLKKVDNFNNYYSKKSARKFYSDELFLISGSEDGKIYNWNLQNPEEQFSYSGNTSSSCTFSISSNADSTLLLAVTEISDSIIRNNSRYCLEKINKNTSLSLFSL